MSSSEAAPAVSVVLPAFNEAARIVGTIEKVAAYFRGRGLSFEILVAADGVDGTRDLARAERDRCSVTQVIGGPERRGKGHGVRAAMRLARGARVGFVDADDKTPIEEYAKVEALLDQGYDVAIGSRARSETVIERPQPLYRRLGSRGFSLFLRTLVDLGPIADTQCGFKFFTAAAAERLFALQTIDGYMFDVEILGLARRLGYRVGQVGVRWRDDGDSRLELVAGNVRNVKDVFRIAARTRRAGIEPIRVAGAETSSIAPRSRA